MDCAQAALLGFESKAFVADQFIANAADSADSCFISLAIAMNQRERTAEARFSIYTNKKIILI